MRYTSLVHQLSQRDLIIGAVALVVCAAFAGWYFTRDAPSVPAPTEQASVPAEEKSLVTDIGASTETATLKDTIPVVAPTTNPIKNIYKNPFE